MAKWKLSNIAKDNIAFVLLMPFWIFVPFIMFFVAIFMGFMTMLGLTHDHPTSDIEAAERRRKAKSSN